MTVIDNGPRRLPTAYLIGEFLRTNKLPPVDEGSGMTPSNNVNVAEVSAQALSRGLITRESFNWLMSSNGGGSQQTREKRAAELSIIMKAVDLGILPQSEDLSERQKQFSEYRKMAPAQIRGLEERISQWTEKLLEKIGNSEISIPNLGPVAKDK